MYVLLLIVLGIYRIHLCLWVGMRREVVKGRIDYSQCQHDQCTGGGHHLLLTSLMTTVVQTSFELLDSR